MNKFVRIQSSVTVTVTAGLQNEDVTNPEAHVPDRLKVSPVWPKLTCLIHEGADWYPSEITSWETVKALANDKILTIGEYSNTPDGNIETLNKLKENLAFAEKEAKQKKKSSELSLNDIVKEE